jgi:16S rRNA (adenine1518-N6/adenine1519-N6)-dimethyltransferase
VLNQNVLSTDIPAMAAMEETRLLVFGNLPYNISSQILIKLIESREHLSRCILMFQKELAERLTAREGKKAYGRLSVMLQYCAEIKSLATVKAHLFYPKPKIDSEIIEIDFSKPSPLRAVDESFFFSVVKAAFSKRRKTLKNALASSELGMKPEQVALALETAAIDPVRRAETLNVEEFVRMGEALATYAPRWTPPDPQAY